MASDQKSFAWSAVALDGKRIKGKMEADSAAQVVKLLQQDGLTPLNVSEQSSSLLGRDFSFGSGTLKLGLGALASLARQLNLLIAAGLSIPRALSVMGEDADKGRYRDMLLDLAERTTAGLPLSKALEEYQDTIPETFRAYIAAGEATGDMERSTARLAHVLEKQNSLRLKIKAVTAYPKMVASAIALLVLGIIMFLVPRYAKIYDGLGQELPAPTQALINLSSQFTPFRVVIKSNPESTLPLPSIDLTAPGYSLLSSPINWMSPLLWIVAGVFGWRYFRRRTRDDLQIGARIERFKWRMPVFGVLLRTQVMFQWSSTMAGALSSGLQTFTALDLAGRTSGSAYLRLISLDLQEAVRAGKPLSGQLARYPELFTSQLRAMASTGEEAGEPALMFQNIAVTLEDELDTIVATLGAKIEVALLMGMGVVVGSLLVVLYLPILGLSNAVGDGFSQ
jgi:type IV pilus assembly protein PilC